MELSLPISIERDIINIMKYSLFIVIFFIFGCTFLNRKLSSLQPQTTSSTRTKNSQIHACIHDDFNLRCVEYVRNYDGDTITFNIPDIHPLIGENINIRVNGVDTPEIQGNTDCEKEKALQAQKLIEDLLKSAKRIDLLNIQRGKYFRIVADVYVDNINLSNYLIKKGFSYPYDGGTKQKPNWCFPINTNGSK